jgi:hypothetical protein
MNEVQAAFDSHQSERGRSNGQIHRSQSSQPQAQAKHQEEAAATKEAAKEGGTLRRQMS